MTLHYHKDDRGRLVKCLHECKNMFLSVSFWVGLTISFPAEHYIWTKVWPFCELSKLMGLD